MNYPIWDQPASGLIIAFISVFHVFISHFAVGGGLFLVLAERKARKTGDALLLDYTRRHTRFFMLVTLVLGAITGVGIWFAIGLVHPAGTSALINIFVWAWGMEWTLFLVEVAAAMVYYYGWDRLEAQTHEAVGWIYFIAAWVSMVIINGIISFQLTPGKWVTSRGFLDGLLNPTFWPSLVARTFVAIGLAGIYALLTNARSRDLAFKKRMAQWAGRRWVLPMVVAIPLSLVWYLQSAIGAGIPAGRIFGAGGESVGAVIASIFSADSGSGYPILQNGATVCLAASAAAALVLIFIAFIRPAGYGLSSAVGLLILGQLAFAGGEWVREDLRKPYVIGHYMFVNSVRLPGAQGAPGAPAGMEQFAADRFSLPELNRSGVLNASLWNRAPAGFDPLAGPDPSFSPEQRAGVSTAAGELIFRQLCWSCHTVDGYLAIRPLVAGKSAAGLDNVLDTLALPVDASGEQTGWDDPDLRLKTRRGFRMPPFSGTAAEKQALSVYLARLGGDPLAGVEAGRAAAAAPDGATVFEENCAICHEPDGDLEIEEHVRGRSADEIYDLIGRLPELSDEMFPFEGTDEERRALADHLAALIGKEVE
jgi:mono/diheme cytochrome c family protein